MPLLEQVRAWFGRPLWEMESADADAYFSEVLRSAAGGTCRSRAQVLVTHFQFWSFATKSSCIS